MSLKLKTNFGSREQRGESKHARGKYNRAHDTRPTVVEMGVEIREADGRDDEVVEVRQQVGKQSICSGRADEEGPAGFLFHIADPVEQCERRHCRGDAVETPRG